MEKGGLNSISPYFLFHYSFCNLKITVVNLGVGSVIGLQFMGYGFILLVCGCVYAH